MSTPLRSEYYADRADAAESRLLWRDSTCDFLSTKNGAVRVQGITVATVCFSHQQDHELQTECNEASLTSDFLCSKDDWSNNSNRMQGCDKNKRHHVYKNYVTCSTKHETRRRELTDTCTHSAVNNPLQPSDIGAFRYRRYRRLCT